MRWLGRVGVVAVVAAVVAGGVWLWGRLDPQSVAAWTTVWAGVVGLVGLAVSGATSGVQAVAGYRRRLAARPDVAGQVRHLVRGRVPWAGEVDVTGLGAKPPIGSAEAGQTPYVARDVDERVDGLVAAGGMLVLAGPAAAGKSRLAAEAVHRLASRSRRRLLVPVGAGSLRALHSAGYRFADTVVVLDDLEHFLSDGGLDAALLAGICAGPSTVVVATIRANVLARLEEGLDGGLESRTGLALYRPGVELLKGLRRQDRIIEVASGLSPGETKRARALDGDGRIWRAVDSDVGFGEYLIAGPAQMARWSRDTGEVLEAVGRAVISAAVDARRAGFDDPLPGHVLDLLTPAYLPPKYRQRATTPSAAAGRDWAAEIVTGTTASSCLIPLPGGTYTAADYLTDRADQPGSPLHGQSVPDATWTILQTHATPMQASAIATAAYLRHDRPDIAFSAITRAAQTPDAHPAAMYNLGILLQQRGDLDGAEKWYRRATETGHTDATFNLGILLEQRGDLDEAEKWYRRATDTGDTGAMNNLGVLLEQRGDLDEAEKWYRRATDTGHTNAMNNLGILLKQRGDLDEARVWFQKADEADDS
ncbi:hypothetical protein Afil01_43220 [Actinorhabdospora filicis]|uniref:Tetratricopeptide repeat protein n=1 Tax=Actinorhabdospora filicis TaxID=1785913 RepID=A0A9W6SP96_9ACTN|nr:tetratricopeptide repeat protein [Actinorhabdospora filicis]GLZ79515.1 hypothetical protein Afil01_43220 [Actinorhabdospora filicis]